MKKSLNKFSISSVLRGSLICIKPNAERNVKLAAQKVDSWTKPLSVGALLLVIISLLFEPLTFAEDSIPLPGGTADPTNATAPLPAASASADPGDLTPP